MLIHAERICGGVAWNLITDSDDAIRTIEATRKGSDFDWKPAEGIYAARFPNTSAVRENLYRISMRCCCLPFTVTQTSDSLTIEFYYD